MFQKTKNGKWHIKIIPKKEKLMYHQRKRQGVWTVGQQESCQTEEKLKNKK